MLQLGESTAEDGKTPLFFARAGRLIGVIAIADIVKPTSRQAVQELSDLGLEVVMLTGDNAKTAEAIRRQVGAGRVVAEVFPSIKRKKSGIYRVPGRKSQWSVTGSMTRQRLPGRMSALRLGPGQTLPLNLRILY